MQDKESIFRELQKILADLFEIDAVTITPASSLYDELQLDSIDAIDLIVNVQELTGRKVKPEQFKSARTVEDVVDIVYDLIQA
jgi:acyl carrier protein